MVDDFVAAVGKGVIRHLILDRGFIDGAAIGRAKAEHGIDTTIGVRSNTDIYRDAAGIASLPETAWQNHTRPSAAVEPSIRRHPVDARHAEVRWRREATRQATLARQRAEKDESRSRAAHPRPDASRPHPAATQPRPGNAGDQPKLASRRHPPSQTRLKRWRDTTTSASCPLSALPVDRQLPARPTPTPRCLNR
jgi:hypothetical protein